MKTLNPLFAAAAVVLVAGCASSPPRELQDARTAYANARSAPGAALAPNDQRDAKLALDRAEQEFDKEGDEESTRALAYVAQRKAIAAHAHSEAMHALEQKQIAQRDFDSFKAMQAKSTAQELDRTKEALEGTKETLEASQAAAQSERAARAAAESKANDALAKIADMESKQTDRGLVLTLSGSVLFATGKSVLLPAAQRRLSEVAKALKDDQRKVTVIGHTDAQGSDESNQRLSESRAKAVTTFLSKEGVPSDRLSAEGMGESQPIADNDSPEGRANNRRVELLLETQSQNQQPQQNQQQLPR